VITRHGDTYLFITALGKAEAEASQVQDPISNNKRRLVIFALYYF
jgi:hypothetical protein